ncbi:DUF4369 domain-containing protein [Carboxylicivirga caseinilyticus]|uniref:DUF4369 domain-containing protein n=1 Tax=Carboxylicivirga caseinilyticus TaxID=3417572 RepID=UPI003D337594|nr:DUF4369 domain-containing protein [Marinilabiliaceae bacterium A049]
MNNWRWILILFVATLTFCKPNNENYQINGKLPTQDFDGEYVYLVPFENATQNTVDSTLIHEGKFVFRGSSEQPEVCILRTRPLLRLQLEEILIIKEPGILNVTLASTSYAQGTVSNDSLQKWKEVKSNIDSMFRQVLIQYKSSSDSLAKQKISLKLDSLKELSSNFNQAFIETNKNNTAGEFVRKILGNNLSKE